MKNNLPQKTIKTIHKPNQPGKWVYKPTRSAVLVCSCGNKYIATARKSNRLRLLHPSSGAKIILRKAGNIHFFIADEEEMITK